MRTYFKVVCDQADEMNGAGLGYDEIYGDGPRFFWDREQAKRRAEELNRQTAQDNATGEYSVEEGHVYDDGSWDDDADDYAKQQLGLASHHG